MEEKLIYLAQFYKVKEGEIITYKILVSGVVKGKQIAG